MKNTWTLIAVATFFGLALTVIGIGAQSLQPTSPTYTWSGELVAFDDSARMLTVKARVVGEQALGEFKNVKAGDKVILTWSGFDSYSDGISRVAKYEASKKWSEPFMFPAHFVAYDDQHHYATIKFEVPSASVDAVKAVKAGEWITATSRHRAASESEAIMAVNSYTRAASVSQSTN